MRYFFKTTATMKEYNNKKWWIDRNIVPDLYITAENIVEAIKQYRSKIYDIAYINISKNAIRTMEPMYIDTPEGEKQTGYVITGSCDFQDDERYCWTKQYIDLWVHIDTIVDTKF